METDADGRFELHYVDPDVYELPAATRVGIGSTTLDLRDDAPPARLSIVGD